MNIILKSFRKLIFVPKFNVVKSIRPSSVLTHRNELKPFSANNLWDNPGYNLIIRCKKSC